MLAIVVFDGATYTSVEAAFEREPVGFSKFDRAGIIAAAAVLPSDEAEQWPGWHGTGPYAVRSNRVLVELAPIDDDAVWELLGRLTDAEITMVLADVSD